jgi:aminoglycoside phosphotransferase (APT) family kinase protein
MNDLPDLLAHLATQPDYGQFKAYHYTRIGGGRNNLIYRATSETSDYAVKFTIRDQRRRARREYMALCALQQVGVPIAAQPIWLDETSYAQPVVVQSWQMGEVSADAPQTDDEWRQLLNCCVALTQVTPEKVSVGVETATLNFSSTAQAHQHIQQQLAQLPIADRPDSLTELLHKLPSAPLLPCPPAPTTLCHVDPNTLNFIRRSDRWLMVDWENSGWGDPAFEIADMMTHPQFKEVSSERWQWVLELYDELVEDDTAVARIRAYYPLMLVWWVVRLARSRYETPRGLDERLVERPSDWLEKNQAGYDHYWQRAMAEL